MARGEWLSADLDDEEDEVTKSLLDLVTASA